MATIKLENLSRKSALKLLKNVQKNHAKSHAIQGSENCRYVYTDTVNATVKPQEVEGRTDFSKNTFEMYSSYWAQSTLDEFIKD